MLSAPASKLQFVVVRDVDADASKVFGVLTSEAGMRRWVPQCRSAVWRHPRSSRGPGVGSVRHIVIAGGVTAAERIVGWEPGRALQYTFDKTTLPIAGLTRDYVGFTQIDSLGPGRSRLTWSIHFNSPGALALLGPAVKISLWPLIAVMAGKVQRLAEAKK